MDDRQVADPPRAILQHTQAFRDRPIPPLREYLLVATAQSRVERFRRTDTAWMFDEAVGRGAVMRLAALDADLPLAELCARIEFPDHPPLR